MKTIAINSIIQQKITFQGPGPAKNRNIILTYSEGGCTPYLSNMSRNSINETFGRSGDAIASIVANAVHNGISDEIIEKQVRATREALKNGISHAAAIDMMKKIL